MSFGKYGNTSTTLPGMPFVLRFDVKIYFPYIIADGDYSNFFHCFLLTFRLPPGPVGLPFLGVVNKLDPAHVTVILQKWKDVYGDIFSFTLPGQSVVVVRIVLFIPVLVSS